MGILCVVCSLTLLSQCMFYCTSLSLLIRLHVTEKNAVVRVCLPPVKYCDISVLFFVCVTLWHSLF